MKRTIKNYGLATLALMQCYYAPMAGALNASLVDSINPFVGASTRVDYGEGKTFPGAATPFGRVQLSPDTITGGVSIASGSAMRRSPPAAPWN
jgi:putative alpha-1,2-mannosidase